MITIIDYGMGNLRSVQKAFEKFHSNVIVSSYKKDILKADKIVLPGVGAFGAAMYELKKRDLVGSIKEAIEKARPFLGICLGLQLLFSESEEAGKIKGLDIIKGRVKRFKERRGLKIPHMGWNEIRDIPRLRPSTSSGLCSGQEGQGTSLDCVPRQARDFARDKRDKVMKGVPNKSYMYFVHSYYVEPEDKDVILCETDYGCNFTSGVRKGNVYGFQFHPEKSQAVGLKIIENFVKI